MIYRFVLAKVECTSQYFTKNYKQKNMSLSLLVGTTVLQVLFGIKSAAFKAEVGLHKPCGSLAANIFGVNNIFTVSYIQMSIISKLFYMTLISFQTYIQVEDSHLVVASREYLQSLPLKKKT